MEAGAQKGFGAQIRVTASPTSAPLSLSIPLQPPRTAFPLVMREALLARLLASTVPLVVVSGSAGSGKTTLLGQWAERDARPQAWLQLDASHNDPLALVNTLGAALEPVAAIDPGIARWAGLVAPPLRERMLPSLQASLGQASPFLLILDDAQFLTSKAGWEIVESLLGAFPAGGQLALGARTEPQLPLARLKAAGRLLEIGGSDLAFSAQETAELLELRGLDADEETAATLRAATEGWAAGISLAALAHDNGAGTPEWAAAIHGDQRDIARYLITEVLERQSRSVRSFLLQTSILELLSEDSCRAVTGRTDAGHLLARLQRDNLFVCALGDAREWYRYHHLFAELLAAELRRRDGARLPELHRRAATWCEERGEFEGALRHWLAAGEEAKAAQVICRAFFLFSSNAGFETIRRWLELLTDEQIRRSADLTLVAGWVATMTDDSPRNRKWRSIALSEPIDDSPLPYGGATGHALQSLFRVSMAPDGVTAMHKEAQLAAELAAESHPAWRAASRCALGLACWLSGDDLGAEKALRRTIEEGGSANLLAELGAMGYLSLLLAHRGRWEEAEALATSAAQRLRESESGLVGNLIAVPLARERVLAHRGAPEVAGEVAAVEAALASTFLANWLQLLTVTTLAEIAFDRGDLASVERWTTAGMATLRAWPDAGIFRVRLEGLRRALEERRLAGHLTSMERQVLELLATHLALAEIAQRLLVSQNTLKTHMRGVYGKLNVHSRSEAVERARDLGLLRA